MPSPSSARFNMPLLFTLSVLIIGIPAAAESGDHGWRSGLNMGAFLHKPAYGPQLFFGPSVENKNLFLSVSPTFGPELTLLPDRVTKTDITALELNGAYMAVQLKPSGSRRLIEMSFNYDFTFNLQFDGGRDPARANDKYVSVRKSFGNYIGYGMNINIYDNLFIMHSVGAGINSNLLSVEYEVRRDYEGRYNEPTFMLKFGIGCRIN